MPDFSYIKNTYFWSKFWRVCNFAGARHQPPLYYNILLESNQLELHFLITVGHVIIVDFVLIDPNAPKHFANCVGISVVSSQVDRTDSFYNARSVLC